MKVAPPVSVFSNIGIVGHVLFLMPPLDEQGPGPLLQVTKLSTLSGSRRNVDTVG